MSTTDTYDRAVHAAALHSHHHRNDWDGSSSPRELAQAAYAVVISREDDGWILAAADRDQVAAIYLATLTGTEGYDEWIECVVRMRDGSLVELAADVSVHLQVDGGHADASTL